MAACSCTFFGRSMIHLIIRSSLSLCSLLACWSSMNWRILRCCRSKELIMWPVSNWMKVSWFCMDAQRSNGSLYHPNTRDDIPNGEAKTVRSSKPCRSNDGYRSWHHWGGSRLGWVRRESEVKESWMEGLVTIPYVSVHEGRVQGCDCVQKQSSASLEYVNQGERLKHEEKLACKPNLHKLQGNTQC